MKKDDLKRLITDWTEEKEEESDEKDKEHLEEFKRKMLSLAGKDQCR